MGMNSLRFREAVSATSVTAVGLVLVAALGVVDYITGPEISFSIFYLIPIALVSWVVGLAAGLITSALAAVSYLAALLMESREFSHPSIPFWNAVVRMGFFFVVTVSLASLRHAIDRQEELRQFIIHDLRSPLANVMTGLQILRDDTGQQLDDRQQGFVEMCLVSCTRMLTLINSLLDLSRLERNGMPLNRDAVEAFAICESALNQVRLWAMQRNVRLDAHVPDDAVVHADAELTERVLVNLLSNAVKHAPDGSVITLRVAEHHGKHLAFSVEDEGAGIPRELTEKVFETYAQVDTSGTGFLDGTGLGLAFSRKAVEAQGGRIWMKSAPDAGTIVTFTLPRATESRSANTGIVADQSETLRA